MTLLVCDAGAPYPAGDLGCTAYVHLQKGATVTAAAIRKTAAAVPVSPERLTNICKALSMLTAPPKPSASDEQSEQELQVFCNPLFGA